MNFRPLHDGVVVRRLEEDEKSAGGIIIPDTAKEKPSQGEVLAGAAAGREALRTFYREIFIPQMPPDAELQLLTRSVGQNRVIDEFVLHFTHTVPMDWFAPGIAPTGRRLVLPHVAIIAFRDGKICSEHIYWDHANVLLQLGILEDGLPALGANQANRLLKDDAPANELIRKFTKA